jgi:Na+-transporting NADH:ubiquinone oxidoreductase subunit C
MKPHSTAYTFGFATAMCLVFSVLVASAAVSLKPLQEMNAKVYKQKNVLIVAGAIGADESLSNDEIGVRFEQSIRARLIDRLTGEYVADEESKLATYDSRKALSDPEQSMASPGNPAKLQRLANDVLVYHVVKDNAVDMIILPIEGKGLWSTLYGFLAMDKDMKTIRGITFYAHAETPGLGGEIDNPKWKALWPERLAFDETGSVAIEVVKGQAATSTQVDGLSGATLTSRGVSELVRFWLGAEGFGPYIEKIRQDAAVLSVS